MRDKIIKVLKPEILNIDLDDKERGDCCGEYFLKVNIEGLEFSYTLPNWKRNLVIDVVGKVVVKKHVSYCNVHPNTLEFGVYTTDGEPQDNDLTMSDICELLTDYCNDNLELF